MDSQPFTDWLTRVRAGDRAAVAEFVARFEPQIRRAIRIRSAGGRVARVLGSDDLCQTAFRRFFAQGVTRETPEELLKWLLTVALNRRADAGRAEHARKRGGDRARADGSGVLAGVPDPAPGPADRLEDREVLDRVLARLTPEERALALRHADGDSWEAIAADLGVSAQTLRQRHHRAVKRAVEGPD